MPKEIYSANFNLAFTADTGKAKAQLQDLQKQLTDLTKNALSPNSKNAFTKEIQEASKAALDLKNKLEQATNANTGKLDLSKLSKSINDSGMSIEKYRQKLRALGPEGDKAFSSLATSIMKAEVPLKTTSKLLDNFKTTLLNSARWQISSDIMHGITGAIQNAYNYAQDLNRSLNDIQIVTGHSAEYMDQFAQKANKAAQELSTTTNNYTKASLIFYQQGLGDKEVEERTNAVIKMSQVTGDSATDVSSYMTAIWNNFDDGSESLEHYADVITALGASTASSSSEIASGLQQFAAIGETVGLSYDYATASLAALVANTRQSADTIGNSLKTIFSRLQGLQQGGETEDGVDLNKYSKALKGVGVDIIDAENNMKSMDTILEELAARWDTLSEKQQMALAQTVGGTRQYTQLISLMNNWDDVQTNLQTATNADGTLQEQADIYAKSWEAASKRVRAAAEEIYTKLIDDDFFIKLLDGFKGFLNIVSKTIDAMGGLKGVLITVGAIASKLFRKEIASEINRMQKNFQIVTGQAQKKDLEMKTKTAESLKEHANEQRNGDTGDIAKNVYDTRAKTMETYIKKNKELTAIQKQQYQNLMDIQEKEGDILIKKEKEIAQAKRLAEAEQKRMGRENEDKIKDKLATRMAHNGTAPASALKMAEEQSQDFLERQGKSFQSLGKIDSLLNNLKLKMSKMTLEKAEGSGQRFEKILIDIMSEAELLDEELENQIIEALKNIGIEAEGLFDGSIQKADEFEEKLIEVLASIMEAQDGTEDIIGQATEELANILDDDEIANDFAERNVDIGVDEGSALGAAETMQEIADAIGEVSEEGGEAETEIASLGDKFSAATQAISTGLMLWQGFSGIIETIGDDSLSTGDKIQAIGGTVAMMIPMVLSSLSSLAAVFPGIATAATAMWTAITGPIGIVFIAITAVTAALAVFLYSEYRKTTPEYQLEQATKKAEKLKEELAKTTQASEELKASFDKYNSAREALDSCIKGTVEWKEALLEVNTQVLDLLDKYPELAGYISRNEDGVLEISEAGQDKMLDLMNERVLASQTASFSANQEQRNASIEVQRKNVKFTAGDSTANEYADEVLKQLINRYGSNFTEKDFRKELTAAGVPIDSDTINKLVEELINNRENIKELAGEVEKNTLATETENDTLAATKLSNNDLVNNSEYKDLVISAVGNSLNAKINSKEEQLKEEYTHSVRGDGNPVNAGSIWVNDVIDLDTLWEEYAKSKGFDVSKGTKDGEEYKYSNGETEFTIDADAMLKSLAATEAMQGLDSSAENLVTKFEKLGESSSKADKGLLDFASSKGNFFDSTNKEYEKFQEKVGAGKDENGKWQVDSGKVIDYFDKAFGNQDGELDKDELAIFGVTTAEELLNSITKGFEAREDLLTHMTDDLYDEAKIAFSQIDLSEVTPDVQENIANAFQTAFDNKGIDGLVRAWNVVADIKPNDMEKFSDVLSNMQWDSESPESFRQKLKDAGIQTTATTEDLQGYIDACKEQEGSLLSLTDMYAQNQQFINGLSDGDTISKKEFDGLDSNLQQFFQRQLDGSYKLLESAEKVKQAFSDLYTEKFIGQIKDNRNDIIMMQSINERNKDYESLNKVDKTFQDIPGVGKVYNGSENDKIKLQDQINLLKAVGDEVGVTEGQWEHWTRALENGTITPEELDEIQSKIDKINISEETLLKLEEAKAAEIHEFNEALFTSAQNMEDLIKKASWSAENGLGEDPKAYGDGLLSLASAYENTAEEVKKFKAEQSEANQYALEVSIRSGENAAAFDLEAQQVEMLAESYKEYAQSLESVKSGEANAAEIATDLATRDIRLNRGIEDLYNNLDNYEYLLNLVNDASMENVDSVKQQIAMDSNLSKQFVSLKNNAADLLNTSSELLSDDWIIQNMNLIKQAAEGDADALERLQENAVEEVLINSNIDSVGIDIDNLADKINELPDGEIDMSLDDNQFLQDLVWASQAAGMSQEEIESMLGAMGIDVDLEPMEQSLDEAVEDARQAGDEIAQNLSYDAEEVTETSEDEDTKEAVGFKSKLDPVEEEGIATLPIASLGGPAKPQEVKLPYRVYSQVTEATPAEATAKSTTTTKALKIKGANKTSGGNISRRNGSVERRKNRDTRGNRGGNGGNNNRNDPPRPRERQNKNSVDHDEIEKQKKRLEDELDRYHEIENTIDNINEKLDKYSNLTERSFGKSKVKALQAQAKEYDKLADSYSKYIDEAERYLAQDKANAQRNGWTFKADGTVADYDKTLQAGIDKYNQAFDVYEQKLKNLESWWNSMSGDNQELNKDEYDRRLKLIEKDKERATEEYEEFKKSISQYEETLEKIEDLQKQYRDNRNAAIDTRIQIADYTVQVKIEVNDNDLKLLQEYLDGYGDSADHAVDAIKNLSQQIPHLMNQSAAATKGIEEIFKVYDGKNGQGLQDTGISDALREKILKGGELSKEDIQDLIDADMTEETIQKLEEYSSTLLETNASLREMRENALAKLPDAFNEFQEDLDRTSEKIEHLISVNETYKNVIDIVGKKMLDSTGELTKKLDKAAFQMQRNNTHALKSELEFMEQSVAQTQAEIEKLEKSNKDGRHNETIKALKEDLKEFEDARDSTYESWLDSWESECQAVSDLYTDTLEQIVSDFEKAISGAVGNLSNLAEEFSRKEEIADIYAADYEKIYQLTKLTRDIEKSIDETENLKSKQALKKLMEDINGLQEDSSKMSEYDLENLRRQYELELAKDKLKEAQDSKSQVRMMRDSEGNYGYVYTADESAVAEAEQSYEDKLYEMQKANAEYINELQNNIISAEKACSDALAQLDASQFASYEEYLEAVETIQADYNELMDGYYQQLNTVLDNNQTLYNREWQEYNTMTGYKISADEDYIDNWSETTLAILTGFADITTAQETWKQAVEDAKNDCAQAFFDWSSQMEIAMEDGETSLDSFDEKVDEVTENNIQKAQEMEEEANKLAEEYEQAFDDILDALDDFASEWDSKIQSIINKNNQLVENINKVIRAAADLDENTDSEGNTKTPTRAPSSGGGGIGDAIGGSGGEATGNLRVASSGGDGVPKVGDQVIFKNGKYYNDSEGHNPSPFSSTHHGQKVYITKLHSGNKFPIHISEGKRLKDRDLGWLKKEQIEGYDTGGYTGKWNSSDGKLAMLHQKELVLNASDTENILSAVDMIRNISQTIDLNAAAANNLSNLVASGTFSSLGQELQQTVTITAEFPNATNHSEIEQAFDNLVNKAAQFANRKI